MTIQLKRNDTKDTISYTMTYADGTPVNLTGATVRFFMGNGKSLISDGAAVVKSANAGQVEYTLTDADTLIAGTLKAEFQVTFSDGKVKTFPTNGYIMVNIQPNMDVNQSTYIEDQIANRVSDLQVWKGEIQSQLDQFAKGDSAPEVAQARVEKDGTTNTTLKARLDKKEAEFSSGIQNVSAQLAQTSQDLEEREINVKRFGAKGDGETEDTQAFQDALSHLKTLGGGVLKVPKGIYLVDRILIDFSDVIFEGVGSASVIKQKPTNFDEWSDGGTLEFHGSEGNLLNNVHARYVKIDGNNSAHTGDTSNRTKGEGIDFKYCKNSTITYCDIVDCSSDGIDIDDSEDCVISNNVMRNCSAWGVHLSHNSKRITEVGNTAVNCGWDSSEYGVVGGFDSSSSANDNVLIGNTAIDCYQNFGIQGNKNTVFIGNRSLGTTGIEDSTAGALSMDGGFGANFEGNVYMDGVLFTYGTILAYSNMIIERTSTSALALRTKVEGDTQDRFRVTSGGAVGWGNGTDPYDVNMFRGKENEMWLGSGDSFRLDGTWNGGRLLLGGYNLWVDASGKLRIKSGAPTSDTDGSVIGTQG